VTEQERLIMEANFREERERCLKIIAAEQRKYSGGSQASIALGQAAIAIRNQSK